MSFYGKRMKSLMLDRGISSEQLAKKIGVNVRSVNLIISGEIRIPRKSNEIAKALGTTHDYLMHGKKDHQDNNSWISDQLKDLTLTVEQANSILNMAKLMSEANVAASSKELSHA